jgi:pimeloyl-ACP methyl ester carboxylesterase
VLAWLASDQGGTVGWWPHLRHRPACRPVVRPGTDLTAAGHTVITFDNRGCGRSQAPPAPYSVTGMAADTAVLIEHLGLGLCDVIGYSLGGYIAQELAVTRADLVRRLVLLAGAGPAPAYAVARARAAVDLALALDPLPPSFDVADLLLSLHPMAQLQNDDDAVKITISLIEAGAPWTNPGGSVSTRPTLPGT